jgi:hypothetical protein
MQLHLGLIDKKLQNGSQEWCEPPYSFCDPNIQCCSSTKVESGVYCEENTCAKKSAPYIAHNQTEINLAICPNQNSCLLGRYPRLHNKVKYTDEQRARIVVENCVEA